MSAFSFNTNKNDNSKKVWLIIYLMYPGLCCWDFSLNNCHNSLVYTQALGMEKYWATVDRAHQFLPDT